MSMMSMRKALGLSRKMILLVAVLLGFGCESEQQARERAEMERWETARQDNTTAAYAAFLAAFPDGRHAGEATQTLASLRWNEAKAGNTQSLYRDFLRDFPNSPFGQEATSRSRDFAVQILGLGKIDTVAGAPVTGPIVEITRQWEERHVTLDRESVFATTKDGGKVELAYLVPIQPGSYQLRIQAYPDRTGPDGEFSQVTVIPALNTFTKRNVNVFGTNEGQAYFVVELADDKAPVSLGLVYAADYEMLETLHLFGTEIAAGSAAR